MRVSIELDLTPEELPLARELFELLRQITANVRPVDGQQLFRLIFEQLNDPCAPFCFFLAQRSRANHSLESASPLGKTSKRFTDS